MSQAGIDRALNELFLQKKIGSGMIREVYTSDLMPDYVVKVEDTKGKFQNVLEWEIWTRSRELGVSHWLAPCISISGDGMILVQQKTEPALFSELPKKMPAWMGDFKRGNYGFITVKGKQKFVCHDYGYGWESLKYGLKTTRMVTPDWTSHSGTTT